MSIPSHSVRIHLASDSLQPGLGPVDPTSYFASHSGFGPLADTMVRIPHGSWRDDAARVIWSSLMSTEVSLAPSLYATWIVLTSQPTIPAACRRPSGLCVQTHVGSFRVPGRRLVRLTHGGPRLAPSPTRPARGLSKPRGAQSLTRVPDSDRSL
jgi:hypothetical protein